ncbi:MAG: hypothetical protein R3E97_12550 [Candidatus Eisenbacteria bacterium]
MYAQRPRPSASNRPTFRERLLRPVFRQVRAGLLTLVGLSILGAGCGGDDVTAPEPESPYLSATSAQSLMANFITALESRDLDGYAALFDQTEFTFRIDPVDLGDDPGLPEFWDWPVEYTWAKNAFESPDVRSIRLEFDLGEVLDVTEGDGEFVDLTWKKMTITGVHLEIIVENPSDPNDPIHLLVQGDRGLFFFAIDETHLTNGAPTWKIVEWRDIRVGLRPLLTEDHTFAAIEVVPLGRQPSPAPTR